MQPALPERGEHFETTPAGQHEVEDHHIKDLGMGVKEAFFASVGHDHVVVLCFESFLQGPSDCGFIFDHQDTHAGLPSSTWANMPVSTRSLAPGWRHPP